VFKNTAEGRATQDIPIHIGYQSNLARFLVDWFVSSFMLMTGKEII